MERDFVEAPSQMLEEWPRNPKVLRTFAKHYETGAELPVELVEKMEKASAFGRGLDVLRQMLYARISLNYYDAPSTDVDIWSVYRNNWERTVPYYPFIEGSHMPCAFGHLDGYSAVYYTYKWSEVIAKDMFTMFDEDNLLDPAPAMRYKHKILEPGGAQPAAVLVRDFLEREYTIEPWQTWLNGGVRMEAPQPTDERFDEIEKTVRIYTLGLVGFFVLVALALAATLIPCRCKTKCGTRGEQEASTGSSTDNFHQLGGDDGNQL